MDFELSVDQVALRDAAGSLLDGACSIARVREVADRADAHDHYDGDLWSAMADQGWPAVERSVEDGGLGLGMVEVAVLCEQLGRHLAPVPFAGTVVALGALQSAIAEGSVDTQTTGLGGSDVGGWAERLSSGQAIGAVAWSRRADAVRARRAGDGKAGKAGSRRADAVRARRAGDGKAGKAEKGGKGGKAGKAEKGGKGAWTLTGRCDPVVGGPVADLVVVFAETDGGPAVFALASEDGDRAAAEPTMDRTRSVGWLSLDDRPALWLGDDRAADAVLDRATAAVCAEMLGAADVVLAMTVQYAKDRVQFGRPIGGFQAVKHRCADMLVDVEGMRSAAYYAAWAVGAGDPEASAAASAAKVWCSDAARRVMASGLQVHGGIGFTWEHDLHLYLKRSQLDQVTFGDASHHRERIAAILRARAEAGLPVL